MEFRKYYRFLKDNAIYDENARLYEDLFKRLVTPDYSAWANVNFRNGEPIRLGNPIFSAYLKDESIAVRVVQIERDEDSQLLSCWIKNEPFELEGHKEMVIMLQLTQNTFSDLHKLFEGFGKRKIPVSLMTNLNRKYERAHEIKLLKELQKDLRKIPALTGDGSTYNEVKSLYKRAQVVCKVSDRFSHVAPSGTVVKFKTFQQRARKLYKAASLDGKFSRGVRSETAFSNTIKVKYGTRLNFKSHLFASGRKCMYSINELDRAVTNRLETIEA